MSKKKEEVCTHDWKCTGIVKQKISNGYYSEFKEVQICKCSKCDVTKEIVIRSEQSRNEPMWWR